MNSWPFVRSQITGLCGKPSLTSQFSLVPVTLSERAVLYHSVSDNPVLHVCVINGLFISFFPTGLRALGDKKAPVMLTQCLAQ